MFPHNTSFRMQGGTSPLLALGLGFSCSPLSSLWPWPRLSLNTLLWLFSFPVGTPTSVGSSTQGSGLALIFPHPHPAGELILPLAFKTILDAGSSDICQPSVPNHKLQHLLPCSAVSIESNELPNPGNLLELSLCPHPATAFSEASHRAVVSTTFSVLSFPSPLKNKQTKNPF